MLYFCLALLGIDTATLLASAGILTLIVGLGAQTLDVYKRQVLYRALTKTDTLGGSRLAPPFLCDRMEI